MSLRAAKKLAVAADIRRAARTLFVQEGYAEVSMERIAAAAGVSRATLFNYFPGKQVLLDALAGDFEQRLVDLVTHYRSKYQHTPNILSELFSYSGRVLEQTSGLTRLLFLQSAAGAGLPALQAEFTSLIEQGQNSGELRDDIAAARLAEPVYLGFIAALLGWCREADKPLAEHLASRAEMLTRLLARPSPP